VTDTKLKKSTHYQLKLLLSKCTGLYGYPFVVGLSVTYIIVRESILLLTIKSPSVWGKPYCVIVGWKIKHTNYTTWRTAHSKVASWWKIHKLHWAKVTCYWWEMLCRYTKAKMRTNGILATNRCHQEGFSKVLSHHPLLSLQRHWRNSCWEVIFATPLPADQ
jgi:hypothetical protein